MDWEALLAAATAARSTAYAPYSDFPVGAALLLADGTIQTGANVENATPALTLCAERVAVASAVARGSRRGEFQALAVVTGSTPPAPPCGLCLQTLIEFADLDLPILLSNLQGEGEEVRLRDLLPRPFRL